MALAAPGSNSFESIPLDTSKPRNKRSIRRCEDLPNASRKQSWAQVCPDHMVPSLAGSYGAHLEEEKMKDEHHNHRKRKLSFLFTFLSLVLLLPGVIARAQVQTIDPVVEILPAPSPTPACARTIKADVVSLDQAIMYNRLGTVNPGGMIYALKKDLVAIDPVKGLVAGNVRLRSDKRPRPIVLRMNSGDCLRITFTNLLSASPLSDQPATRSAGVHVIGMELVGSLGSDVSIVVRRPP